MTADELKMKLAELKDGKVGIDEIVADLKAAPFEDIGCAKVDLHRELRQNMPEAIYGEGKSSEDIAKILRKMIDRSEKSIIVTRVSEEKAKVLAEDFPEGKYNPLSRLFTIERKNAPSGIGKVVIVTAGTSDKPVAEEAEQTLKILGNETERVEDVGVAGIERLFASVRTLQSASVVIVIAGMEGALASVVGGLVGVPVIAVPTSVGYGAAFGGLAALLGMINSCSLGVSVVNIDNGFGAAVIASRINHISKEVSWNV